MRASDEGSEEVSPGNCNQMTGDGETVTPLLPEPGVWTGMAQANVWAPLRWKHAKIHRGSRQRLLGPHQEAGYTSAVVTVAPDPISVLQSGGVHIRPHVTQSGHRPTDFAVLHIAAGGVSRPDRMPPEDLLLI